MRRLIDSPDSEIPDVRLPLALILAAVTLAVWGVAGLTIGLTLLGRWILALALLVPMSLVLGAARSCRRVLARLARELAALAQLAPGTVGLAFPVLDTMALALLEFVPLALGSRGGAVISTSFVQGELR